MTTRWFYLTLLAALVTVTSPLSAQSTFSVKDVLSYSFASGLVAAPVGDRVAWIENHEGARNIWVAEGPSWVGRAVTDYPEDDGQELSSLTFTPDGEGVVYVRGGAPNRQGEVPDPLHTPDAEERTVWLVTVTGGEPRKIVDAGGFAMSPSHGTLAYTKSQELWSISLEEEAEPNRLARVRGRTGSLTWSPDGTRLAFASNRGDHAFIGVLDVEGGSVAYLDPSVHRDGSPTWSPDSRRVAFLRVPNESQVLPFAPRREGLPFSIRVADVSTGAGQQIWIAPQGIGSAFSGVGAASQIFWGAGDRLVFPWEGDGWKHLYAVPVSGGQATLLTPGYFEVQFAALAPDRRSVIYDSNQHDIDRKHVWRVDVAGGQAEMLTPGQGVEWGAVVTAEGSVALVAASASRPAHAVVLRGGTKQPMGPELDRRFPMDRMVEPEQVIFRAADGMEIHGQLFLPPNHQEGDRNPAVMFFHGGSRRQMLLGFHHRGYYHNAYALNQLLANRGYVVLAVNYRSGIGYGMEFREALGYGAAGASEFNDVLGGGLYLQGRDDVDPDAIALWGGSYGGYLTALGLARASDLFAAGVDLHGVHDWNVVVRNFVPDYNAGDREAFARLAFESSPMADLDGWRSPVLLIHGDDDRNVPFSESVSLAEALTRRGVDFEQLIFPDEVHGFLLHRNWVAAYEATLDFFDRKLKTPIS